MFVPLPNAYGVLTEPLRQTGLVIAVDDALQAILSTLGGNYTYLALYARDKIEIVKVFAVDATGVHIVRAQDNTDACPFNTYDRVKYVPTAAAIEDTLPEITLEVKGSGGITVEGYEITYPELSIEVYGASQIIGDDSSILIGRKEDAYGCCDGDNTPANIPRLTFYLTSQPYQSEAQDRLTYTGALLGGRVWQRPLDSFSYTSDIQGGTLRAVVQQYANWPSDAFSYTGAIGLDLTSSGGNSGGTLVSVLKRYTDGRAEQFTYTADILPSAGTLTVVLRSYTQWPLLTPSQESFSYTGSILGGTIR